MEERVSAQLTEASAQLSDVSTQVQHHDKSLVLLHEGQMHLELNLKMLMTKMGVTPANEIPPQIGRNMNSKAIDENEAAMDMEVDEGRRDLEGDVTLTAEEFDGALQYCTRARDGRARGTSPPRKEAKTGSTPKTRLGGGAAGLLVF